MQYIKDKNIYKAVMFYFSMCGHDLQGANDSKITVSANYYKVDRDEVLKIVKNELWNRAKKEACQEPALEMILCGYARIATMYRPQTSMMISGATAFLFPPALPADGLTVTSDMLRERSSTSDMLIVDSREHWTHPGSRDRHLKDYFDRHGITYRVEKLDVGDYMLDGGSLVIDRKSGLQELSTNLTNAADNARFMREVRRAYHAGRLCGKAVRIVGN